MEYETQIVEVINPLIEFIQSCPFLNTISEVIVVPFNPNITQGNGLSYNGFSAPKVAVDVVGDIRITNQVNFTLNILRNFVDEKNNKETVEFIAKFEQWVLIQSLTNKAPKFSTTFYPEERIWADGGFLWDVVQDATVPYAAYQTNLHIQYQTMIESEDDE